MSLDLAQSAARMFTVGFVGKSITPELRELIARGVGGVIFFARNVGTPEEVAALVGDIKRTAGRPLVVATDQEGGRTARLRDGFTAIPPMRAVGAAGDPELAFAIGQVIGNELRAVGFDMTYSPVLDVDTNPENPIIATRSFGRTAEIVSAMGIRMLQGIQSTGVAACGKHFPGHGDTTSDSHLDLPRLSHPMDRLERIELPPFEAAVRAGVASIMTAHVIFTPLDPTYPATMSRPVLHGILREKMGFDGLIVTDDIEMKAIADHYGIEEAVVRGVNATVDEFLCCHTPALMQEAIDAVIHGVEGGTIDRELVDTANRRILALTQKYAQPASDRIELRELRAPAHLAAVEKVLARVDAESADAGEDPTEVMEAIRLAKLKR
jgi:beta-N-acetylhexosaminidase